MVKAMSHTAKECLGSRLYNGGLKRPHSANNIAISWLEGMAMKALMK